MGIFSVLLMVKYMGVGDKVRGEEEKFENIFCIWGKDLGFFMNFFFLKERE